MVINTADARTVDQLLSVIRGGGQPEYLLFWATSRHRRAAWGKAA